MSHVQKLKERLESKIKEQTGGVSSVALGSTATATATATATGSSAASATSAASKKQSIAPAPIIFLSPEEFAKKQKEDEIKEKQNKLNAKQIASKYNMAYRAFELKAQKESSGSSSFKPGTGTAPRRASTVAKPGATGSKGEDLSEFQKFHLEDDAFWMSELALALAYEDERAINHAILVEFFVENDPSKLAEVDLLLTEWVGREDELFAFLSLSYMDQEGGADGTAEQTAFMMFQTTANKEGEGSGKTVPPVIKDGSSAVSLGGMLSGEKSGASTTSSSTGAKPRRASVINKVALSSQGGIQAASVSVKDEDEEKSDIGNPYILSGVAQDGHIWKVNTLGGEGSQAIHDRMTAAGHTEEEIKAVINQGAKHE